MTFDIVPAPMLHSLDAQRPRTGEAARVVATSGHRRFLIPPRLGDTRMARHLLSFNLVALTCFAPLATGPTAEAQESRFAATNSRSQYVHWIDLYDAEGSKIDFNAEDARPYSPVHTCGRCHDYAAIAHGYHFNASFADTSDARPGEPWIWTDTRTGTQIPMSYRRWPGTFHPRDIGITDREFVLQFGHHLPGGGVGAVVPTLQEQSASAEPTETTEAGTTSEPPAVDADDKTAGRWKLSGELAVDCMICHSNDHTFNAEAWWDQISKENFAWASSVATGLAQVDGTVSSLPDDFDPEAEKDDGKQLPKTTYTPLRVNAENKIFFDVIRKPSDNACYYCHSNRAVGEDAAPKWVHDEDVHLRAGMSCTDCHRNGIGHHTVRGYEGEVHPTGQPVETLSCRGCHMDEHGEEAAQLGGRLGAPKPLHKGLPPLHLDRLSCTACHSGPSPQPVVPQVQTAMAHLLGLPTHHSGADLEPGLTAPTFARDNEVLYPYRMVWPAFWGTMSEDEITPLHPEMVNDAIRRVLRVRRGKTFTSTMMDVKLSKDEKIEALGEERAAVSEEELNEEEQAKLEAALAKKAVAEFTEKLAKALGNLQEAIEEEGAKAVYISAGKAYRLKGEAVEEFAHQAAEPYMWKLGHDVRPARWSTGAKGCYECHALGAPIFEGEVTALGPAPDTAPVKRAMYELAEYDKTKLDAWALSFQGRSAFKWMGFIATGTVGLVLVSFLLMGVNGVFGLFRRA
jgi:hypothetical protein